MTVSVLLSLSSLQCLCLTCNVWLWYFLIILTYFFAFGQALNQANRLENLVQLLNAESHAIGIKPVHGIDDEIARYVFDKCVKKSGYVYAPDNIDKEWLIQFSYDNIALLKATLGSKLFTLHCTEIMAWQCSSDHSLTESFVQQSNRPAKLDKVLTLFHKLDIAKLPWKRRLNCGFYNKTECEIEKDSYKCK